MEITELQREEEKAWDEYVYNSNNSTFYHQIGWRNVVARTYKHRPVYLVAKEGGELKGILPMFLMKSIFLQEVGLSSCWASQWGFASERG